MGRVLVIDDEPRLVQQIAQALRQAGIECDEAASVAQALACIAQVDYAAAIIDRGLPDGEGLDLVRRLRASKAAVPCMVLTARDALHDRVDGLNAGADDYLAKPFDMPELVARTRALLRRRQVWVSDSPAHGDLVVEASSARLRCGQQSMALPPAELQLMLCLAEAQGATVRRSALEAAAWGLGEAVTPNALDVAMHRLRKNLAVMGSSTVIRNVKGVGFELASSV
jgi:DNA-binding response OmpR family regulator